LFRIFGMLKSLLRFLVAGTHLIYHIFHYLCEGPLFSSVMTFLPFFSILRTFQKHHPFVSRAISIRILICH
jgi:hypothetical protein